MTIAMQSALSDAVETTVEYLQGGIEVALPRVVTALLLVGVALIVIMVVTRIVRWFLKRLYPADEALIVDLIVLVISVLLWFAVGLALLTVLGLNEIAASMGTAVGFIALGVSYALSEMLEDTVAGVYLLRDPDFNPGDRVESEKVSGIVDGIGLRKTRFVTDAGDRTIVANRDVERRWTRMSEKDS